MASVGSARPDLNAFLNNRIGSTAELVRQVRNDPSVLDRYRRHFAMDKGALVAYFSTLQVVRLTKPGTYRVYSVPPDGHIKAHMQELRAGMPVLADLAGTPVLVLKCGNPLTTGPNNPYAANVPEAEVVSRPTEKSADYIPDTDIPASADLLTLAPDVPTVPDEVVTVGHSPVIIPAAAVFGFNPLLLSPLGFLFVKHDHDHVNTVPEPATLGVLAVGLVAFRRQRRRR